MPMSRQKFDVGKTNYNNGKDLVSHNKYEE